MYCTIYFATALGYIYCTINYSAVLGYIDFTIPSTLAGIQYTVSYCSKQCHNFGVASWYTVQNCDMQYALYSACCVILWAALTRSTVVDAIVISDDSPVATASHSLFVLFIYLVSICLIFVSYFCHALLWLDRRWLNLKRLPSIMTALLPLLPIQ